MVAFYSKNSKIQEGTLAAWKQGLKDQFDIDSGCDPPLVPKANSGLDKGPDCQLNYNPEPAIQPIATGSVSKSKNTKNNQKSKSRSSPGGIGLKDSFGLGGDKPDNNPQTISPIPSVMVRALGRLIWKKCKEEKLNPDWRFLQGCSSLYKPQAQSTSHCGFSLFQQCTAPTSNIFIIHDHIDHADDDVDPANVIITQMQQSIVITCRLNRCLFPAELQHIAAKQRPCNKAGTRGFGRVVKPIPRPVSEITRVITRNPVYDPRIVQSTIPMARRYLAVPATSAASERVFSQGRRIVSWQRSSLEPETIEQLLCLKEWYQLLDSPL
ncbi:hypothetical protein PGTUg99_017221 [Puccinia graminis f. sp. tritici]|nr:hypothetical protein PGTUg99_017221 [Puccinia graminis f. sp. tritici]